MCKCPLGSKYLRNLWKKWNWKVRIPLAHLKNMIYSGKVKFQVGLKHWKFHIENSHILLVKVIILLAHLKNIKIKVNLSGIEYYLHTWKTWFLTALLSSKLGFLKSLIFTPKIEKVIIILVHLINPILLGKPEWNSNMNFYA